MSSVDVTALSIKITSEGIQQASTQLGGLSTSAANATKRINDLITAMQRLNTIAPATNALTGSTAALTAALNTLNTTLTALNQRTTQADQSQRRHNDAMRDAHGLARGLSGSLGALWITYGNFASMAVGIGIGASLKGIVVIGKDVEHILEGIRVKGSETIESINEMRKSLFELGKGVYGPQQVAQAFETLVLAGLDAEEALSSVNAAMNLALIGGTTIEKAATTLVSVGTAVGYVAEGYDRVADVIAKTAALSMSSVASLSEAFKSGSSVNKLYGVTLEDIGTNLGVLSNLGIQGSAAGTAMKNFYKELAADSGKVTDTLKMMKMSAADFKDSDGFFLPLLDVVKKLSEGMSNLKGNQQQLALANLTNERGMRLAVQLLGEYNTKTGESSNALIEFRKNVENSYGFAAIGAVAMSLTAKSQIDSMMNTLRTSFAETFTEMQPEIIAFSGRMKEIFGSESFKNGIRLLAQSFANLAVAIANNLPLITNLVLGFTAVKLIIAGGAMWTAAVAGLTSIAAAFRLAAAGALTLQAALGPIAIALAVVTAGVILYNNAMADSNKNITMATDYSKGYLAGLEEEADRLEKVNKQLQKKLSLDEANKAITRGEAKDKMVELNNKAILEAQNNLENGIKWTGYTRIAQQKELNSLRLKAIDDLRKADEIETKIMARSKANADLVKQNAIDNRQRPEGDGTLEKGPSKAAINDSYSSAMLEQMNVIRSAKREMAAFEEQINARFKTGEIGKLQVIEMTSQKQIDLFIKAQDARRKQLEIATGAGDKSDATRVQGDMAQAQEDLDNKNLKNRIDKEVALTQAVQDYTKLRIVALEAEGSYGQAAMLRWSQDHSVAFEQAKKDAEEYGTIYPVLVDRVNQLKAVQQAAVKDGLNKEAFNEFNVLADAARNSMKGIQTENEGYGLASMFDAATEASNKYTEALPRLQEEMSKLTNPKDIEEANARMLNLAETQRKLWVGVGESISNSLSSAFGSAGDAAGKFLMVAVNAGQTDSKLASQKQAAIDKMTAAHKEFGFSSSETAKKTGEINLAYAAKEKSSRIKAYGDMAGAAKSFFKEGSTGYQVLEKAEQAFRVIELIGMAKSLAATLTNSAAKATAMIPEFMMGWGRLGPWGYAAGAVAIAAILGSSGGGGSAPMSAEDRQKQQGTGSVFGSDEKSASIANSLEIMEKNSGLGLVHSNEMVKHLRTVASSITGLANIIVRTTGISGNLAEDKMGAQSALAVKLDIGPLGDFLSKYTDKITNSIFGGKVSNIDGGFTMGKTTVGSAMNGGVSASQYSDIKKDGGMFRSDKYSTSLKSLGDDANGQFSKIVSSMSDAIKSAGGMLGISTAKLNTFIIDIGKISLKGLDGAQIKEQLEAVFSKLGDDMAKFALVGLEQFQNVGEGYLETVTRLANDLMQVKDVFAVLNKSFALTGMAAITVSENLITAAGGLEKLTEGTKYFVDNFLTEAERMGPITSSVARRLLELNMGEITSIDLFTKKIRALDLTNAADQLLYAALIELAPAFKEVADYADELAEGTTKLSKAQQKALDAITKARDNLQASYDKEADALQNTIDKTKSFIQTLKNYQDGLKLGADSPLTNMQKYAEARKQFDATALAAQGGDQAAKDKLTGAASALLAASKIINASGEGYTSDFNLVQNMLDQMIGSATSQVDVATASLNALNQQVAGLLEVNKSVMSVTQAITELKAAIIAGGIAGLSNTQMGTTYTPTAAEISAATPTGGSSNQLAQSIAEMKDKIVAEMKAAAIAQAAAIEQQTGVIVKSAFDSTGKAAETTVKAIEVNQPQVRETIKIA